MKDKCLSKQSLFSLFNIPMGFESGMIWIRFAVDYPNHLQLYFGDYIITSTTVSHDIGCTPPSYISALVQLVHI